MKLVINERKCPAIKEMCQAISACPNAALSYIIDETLPLGGKNILEETLCDFCGICAIKCCGNAIEIV